MTSSVRSESSAVLGMAKSWPMLRALLGGTQAMREAGEQFLPKWPNEEAESYKARLKVATLYPAFSRTVEVMASKPFSKAVTLSDDVPSTIVEWCEDIDLQGRNLHSFASEIMRDCIGFGISGVLVDYPKADAIDTLADERVAGIRPYFVHYKPGTVLGWRNERINGAETLIQLRLLETVTEHDGEFGEKEVEQVRVLVPGAWATYRKHEKEVDTWILHEEGLRTLNPIPFVFFYGERTGFGTGKPPLLELAHLNVEHWQSASDQQTITHVARVPILTIVGADDVAITVGASTAVKLPQGASMSFVEHTGAAIEAGRTSILDLEERMQKTGSQLIAINSTQKTATEANLDNEGNKCALQKITESFEDAMDEAIRLLGAWVGEKATGNVTIYKQFGEIPSDASWESILKAVISGIVSSETAFNEAKRRGLISEDCEWDTEQERISTQGPNLGMVGELPEDPPVIETETPEPPDTVDLQPILDAIKAIPTVEMPEREEPDYAPDFDALTKQIADLSAKVDAPQTAELDLTPVYEQISALAEQVKAIPTPEPVNVDSLRAGIMQDVQIAMANLPKSGQPIVMMGDKVLNVKKKITLTYDEDGKPIGAISEEVIE